METSSTTSSTENNSMIYRRKFQVSLGIMGAVSAVIWASQTGRKGKFWWWIGGGLIGQGLGFLLDGLSKKNNQ